MENLAIQRIDSSLLDLGSLQVGPAKSGGADFGKTLGAALREVEKLQTDADRQATQVALGGGNLHETAIALEQADIAMRVATKVRNKLVDAYQEIMRMSI